MLRDAGLDGRDRSTRCSKAGRISSTGCCRGEVQLVFNTTEGAQAITDSFSLRRTALTNEIPYYTTVAGRPGGGGGDSRR